MSEEYKEFVPDEEVECEVAPSSIPAELMLDVIAKAAIKHATNTDFKREIYPCLRFYI